MTAKPPSPEQRWRIMRGDQVLASFVSEELALQRFRTPDCMVVAST
jgi:hypothetical protein